MTAEKKLFVEEWVAKLPEPGKEGEEQVGTHRACHPRAARQVEVAVLQTLTPHWPPGGHAQPGFEGARCNGATQPDTSISCYDPPDTSIFCDALASASVSGPLGDVWGSRGAYLQCRGMGIVSVAPRHSLPHRSAQAAHVDPTACVFDCCPCWLCRRRKVALPRCWRRLYPCRVLVQTSSRWLRPPSFCLGSPRL